MITGERKLVSIETAERIIKESKTPEEAIEKLRSLPRWQPRPPAPEGGISLRAAERKFGISNVTLSLWTRKGYLPIIKRTANEVFVNERLVAEIAKRYKEHGGRGKWVIREIIKDISSLKEFASAYS